MKNLIAILATLMLGNTIFAQCENGVCKVPTRAPVLQALAAPLVSVIETQPVRRTVAVTVNMVANVPQVVRRTKPVRSLARLPLNVLRSQPVRSFARRIFCR